MDAHMGPNSQRLLAAVAMAAVVATTLAGCSTTTYQSGSSPSTIGSGKVVTEQRTTDDFQVVSVASVIQAEIRIGAPLSISVTADDNIVPLVKTAASAGRMMVAIDGSIRTSNPIKVAITVPQLSSASASASAMVTVSGLATDDLQLRGDAASELRVSGSTHRLTLQLTGASKAKLAELKVTTATVDLQAASMADVTVSESVSGSVAAASVLTVGGHPATMKVTTLAAGEVKSR